MEGSGTSAQAHLERFFIRDGGKAKDQLDIRGFKANQACGQCVDKCFEIHLFNLTPYLMQILGR